MRKRTALSLALIIMVLASAIMAFGCSGGGGCAVENLDDEPLKGEIVADFTKTAAEREKVFESDGWTNGEPFNVVWKKKNVTYAADAMRLGITQEKAKVYVADKEVEYDYTAGEVRTSLHYGYGDFEVSMKPAKKAGTASTFFTCTGPYDKGQDGKPQKHDEIDIEFLGKDTTKVQFNYFVGGKGGHEYMYNLGFDASEAYHSYGYRWTKDYIVWFVDGKPVHKVYASDSNPLPSAPGRMLMNYWCGTMGTLVWLGGYSDPKGETADYQWIKTSAQGINLTPQVENTGRFKGDWATIDSTDLTFTAGNEAYTVTKTEGVTNVTYTAVKGNSYINVNAPITTAAAEKNWVHLTLKNNAETAVQVRANIIDDVLADAQNKSTNLAAFMDGTEARTDLEWGGSFFDIPAGGTVKAEINFKGTADSLELMIDSARNDATDRAGNVSISNIKFAKQGEIGEVTAPEVVKPTVKINDTDIEFGGNLSDYDVTSDSTNNTLTIKYEGVKDMDYFNINAPVATIAANHNLFTVKIKNNGAATALVHINIESETEHPQAAGNDKHKCCNVSATMDDVAVETDLEYGGSKFNVPAGATVVAKIIYTPASTPKEIKFFIDSSVWKDVENGATKDSHTGEIVLSEMSFGDITIPDEDNPPARPTGSYTGDWSTIESTDLTFTAGNEAYTVTKTEGVTNVTYTAVKGNSYINVNAPITEAAAQKNWVHIKIKNNAETAVQVRVNLVCKALEDAAHAQNKSSNITAIMDNATTGVRTDTEWGGSYFDIAAGKTVIVEIKFKSAATSLQFMIDSARGDETNRAGDVSFSDIKFAKEGEIEQVQVPDPPATPPAAPTLSVNNSTLTFSGNKDIYNPTTDATANTLTITYANLQGGAYQNLETDVSSVASSHSVLKFKIQNKGAATALVHVKIDSNTVNPGAADGNKCCNVSATMNDQEVVTDIEYGGSKFNVPAGATVVAKVIYNNAAQPTKLIIFFDSSIYQDTKTYSSEIVLSEMEFKTEQSTQPTNPPATPTAREVDISSLTFAGDIGTTTNTPYTVTADTTAKTQTITYSGTIKKYTNINTSIADIAGNYSILSLKVQNKGTASVQFRIDIQSQTVHPQHAAASNHTCCNVSISMNGTELTGATNFEWGGSSCDVPAGATVVIKVVYTPASKPTNLMFYIDSSIGSDPDPATHSGEIVLSEMKFEGAVGRVTADANKIANFSNNTAANGFEKANNYSNGDMFNCAWKDSNITFADGAMKMTVKAESVTVNSVGGTNTTKTYQYTGAEYRSTAKYGHGFYSVKMKPIKCPGIVTSFFTYTNDPQWDEIDIEFLGKDTTKVQFNYYVNGVGGHEYMYTLGFDASESFHEYGFEWLEDSITWYVDGKAVYTVSTVASKATDGVAATALPSHNMQIMVNVWNGADYEEGSQAIKTWLGELDTTKLPVTAEYQWIGFSAAPTTSGGSDSSES